MRVYSLPGTLACLLILWFFPGQSMAQSVPYAMPELNMISSIRSEALGEATVALDGYPGAAQINPASIGRNHIIQGSSYFFGAAGGSLFRRNIGLRWTSLYQPNFDYRSNRWAAALLTTYYDLGEQTQTDAGGNQISRFRSYRLGISGSGSWELSPDLRVGFGLRYITSHLLPGYTTVGGSSAYNAHSIAMDLGLLYQRSFDTEFVTLRPSAGWSLTNFGGLLRYSPGVSDPLPMTMRGGIGLRLISKKEMYNRALFGVGLYGELSHILARKDINGNSYGPLKSLFKGWSPYSVYSSYSVGDRRISFSDQFYTHFGFEVTLLGALSYRFGYINRPTALGFSNQRMFGVGADLYYIVFDYTRVTNLTNEYIYSKDENLWQVTIRIPLEKPIGGIIPSLLNR